jgi:hypothetical protein
MDMPNQAWNDAIQTRKNELMGPEYGLTEADELDAWQMARDEFEMRNPMRDTMADYDRWNSANMGPDDFRNPDDWAMHQEYMQQGPTPGPRNFTASSGDPAQLIQQAALDMIQQGVSPAEAIQAATMQFSDLLP